MSSNIKLKIATPVAEGCKPELLIIFSHPNKEDLEARKFGVAGFATTEVKAGLAAAGIPLEKVHFTAMVKHGIGSKSKPSAEDIEEFAQELDNEIEQIKPKLIMPLGAEVFKRIMKANTKMGDYLGEIIDTSYGKALANYSPGMIVAMDPTKRPEFRDVFLLAKRALDNNLNYDKYRYILVDDPEVNKAILEKYIEQEKFDIGYDAEWYTETKWTDDEVMYEFQYSCEKDVAIILNISKDGVSENRELLDTMKLLLEHPKARRMGWNIRVDDLRLRHRGFDLPDETLAFDGMKAVAFFDSRLSKGLETGIKMFTNYEPYYTALNRKLKEHKLSKSEMSKLKFLEPEVYYHYCAGDAVSHREACLQMMHAFPENLKDHYYKTYLPLTHYLTDMEFTGIPIDKNVLADITDKYTVKYEELKQELIVFLRDRFGIEDFNPNSAPQKKSLLFETLQVTPAYYTKSGKSPKAKAWYDKQKPQTQKLYEPSTNSKSVSTIKFQLEELIEKDKTELPENRRNPEPLEAAHKALGLLLSVSRLGVFATKFLSRKGVAIDPESELDDEDEPLKQSYWAAISNDGRVHASFFECLKNFRASSSPNVQNPASKVLVHIPDIFVPGYNKLDKDQQKEVEHLLPKNIRNIFYSGDPDYYFVESDVLGADIYIMALLSGDPDFIQDFRQGGFHQTKMREYFQDPALTKKDVSKYTISKGITFRVSYTAGLKFAAVPIQADIYAESGLSVKLSTIDYALGTWNRYKSYMAFRDRCTSEVQEKQQITNARGQILKYEETDNFGILAGWMNESLAYPVASELANYMWDASVNLKKLLKKEGLWMRYIYPVNTVHDAGYWIVHKDLCKDNYIAEVIKYAMCHQTKIATGDNVGCEIVVSDCWKGKKIFEKETMWSFDQKQWIWKE